MPFEKLAPDLTKLQDSWDAWEKGEETRGRVLANLKIAGFAELLRQLTASDWRATPDTA